MAKKKSLLGRVIDNMTAAPRGLADLVSHFAENNKPPVSVAAPPSNGGLMPFGVDPTAGLPTSNPVSADDLLKAGQGVGTALSPGTDYSYDPNFGQPPSDPVNDWLTQALATLGGGPDRNAYIAPFDAAEGRAHDAYNAALPVIAQQYDQLRQNLSQHQQDYQGQVAATQQAQQAGVQSQQGLLNNLQAPVLADLKTQGGNAAVGSLTGALQAAMAAGQANLGQQGLAQKQLSDNLANAGNQSFEGRQQDAQAAQTAAQGNAAANLNSILNQIGVQRAGAEQQYASAADQFARQRAGLQLQALEAKQSQSDPLKVLQMQSQLLQNQKLQNELSPDTSAQDALQQWHLNISEQSPVAYDYLTDVLGNSDSLAQALAKINQDQKNGKIRYGGKNLDAATLRQWASEATRLEAAASSKK